MALSIELNHLPKLLKQLGFSNLAAKFGGDVHVEVISLRYKHMKARYQLGNVGSNSKLSSPLTLIHRLEEWFGLQPIQLQESRENLRKLQF